ncbi:hypothetical protein [Pandoravirus japonicus]|uniref:DUF5848 domain-containing protein n=1 Tax=Pandoravirus japonicus TaxID=2823154 RepID=A0A811BNX4_9VIRU|nr:hypothetical protein [Pandoravirus japonicus]
MTTDPTDPDLAGAVREWTDATGWRYRDPSAQSNNAARPHPHLANEQGSRQHGADKGGTSLPPRPATIVRHVDRTGAAPAMMAAPAADLAAERSLLEARRVSIARRADGTDAPPTDSTQTAAVYVASMTGGMGKRRLTIDSRLSMLSVACPSAQRDGAAPAAVGLSALALWQTQCIEWDRPELAGLRRLGAYDDAPPSVALFHLDVCGSPAPLRANAQYGAFMREDEHDGMVRAAPTLLALAERVRRPLNLQCAAAVAVARQSAQACDLLDRSDLLCLDMQRLVAAVALLCPRNEIDICHVAPILGVDVGHDESRERLGLAVAAALARMHDLIAAP